MLFFISNQILFGQKLTPAADVYGFELLCQKFQLDKDLLMVSHLMKISQLILFANGLRPEFTPGTPKFYIEFIKQCMDQIHKNVPLLIIFGKT